MTAIPFWGMFLGPVIWVSTTQYTASPSALLFVSYTALFSRFFSFFPRHDQRIADRIASCCFELTEALLFSNEQICFLFAPIFSLLLQFSPSSKGSKCTTCIMNCYPLTLETFPPLFIPSSSIWSLNFLKHHES